MNESKMANRVSTRAFREFPPEVREMIYLECFTFPQLDFVYPKIKTPSFLAALRGEHALYSEALHCYYQQNPACVTHYNFDKFSRELGAAALMSIRHLRITLGDAGEPMSDFWRMHALDLEIKIFEEWLRDNHSRLLLASNTETIMVEVRSCDNSLACPLITELVEHFPKLRRVEVTHGVSLYEPKLVSGLDMLLLGIKEKCTWLNRLTEADHVVWERQDGGLLRGLQKERKEEDGGGQDESREA